MNTVSYVPGVTNHDDVIGQVMEIAKSVDKKRKNRILFSTDVQDLLDAIDSHLDATIIRSYSKHGFVANSYKWPAEITYCQSYKNEDGTYMIGVYTTDAKRSYGNGALITIDGHKM